MLENRHLERWHRAGLIDEATRAEILAWEQTQVRPIWLWALSGVGAFTILLGVLALVAANWAAIPGAVKVGGHLLLDLFVAGALFWAWTAGKELWRELCALFLYGLVLTSIGLIGQVFQLDGTVDAALLLWMALCTPFLAFFTRSGLLALAWVAGYGTTAVMAADTLLPLFSPAENAGVLPLAWTVTLLLLALGVLRSLTPATRRQGDWMEGAGIAALTIVASLPEAMLRIGASRRELESGWLAVAGAFVLFAALVLWKRRSRGWTEVLLPAAGIATWWLTVLAARVHANPEIDFGLPENGQLLVALIFVAFWAFTGWLALRRGHRGLFFVAFLVITGRIFLFYWEAFGSLLSTGLGLIGGGALCLGLASLGWRLSRRAARGVPA